MKETQAPKGGVRAPSHRARRKQAVEQVVYFSELQELASEREKEIFDALLRLGKEKSLRGKKITWEELEQRAPELAGCTHSTLRYYLQFCGASRMLYPVRCDGEGVVFRGATWWGESRGEKGGRSGFGIIRGALALFGVEKVADLIIFLIEAVLSLA